MDKQCSQNPLVMLERLSPVVIDALQGQVVQNYEMLQALPTLSMTMLSMLLRRKVLKQIHMPHLEVVLERLPEDFIYSRANLQEKRTSKLLANSKKIWSKVNINKDKSLQDTLECLPKRAINVLAQKRISKSKTQKRGVGRPKKYICKG